MNKAIVMLALCLTGAVAQACPKSSSIAGYDDLIRTYAKKNYEEFNKRYEALCAKEKKRFTCSSEAGVAEVRAEEREKALLGNDKCKDAFKVPAAPGTVTLLFLKTN